MYDIHVNNFEMIGNSGIAVLEDFRSPIEDFLSPMNQDASYLIGKKEKECALSVDPEDTKEIAIVLNENLGLKVLKCQENPKNEISCCLTKNDENLDFLYKNGEQHTPLFRISLLKPQITNTKSIKLGDLLSYDLGLSFREMSLYYVLRLDLKHLFTGHPFRQSLKTDKVGRISK